MRRVHSESGSTAVSPRRRGRRVASLVVCVFVLLTVGAVANASAATTAHAGTPALCGFAPKFSAAENPAASFTGAAMAKAMANPSSLIKTIQASFANLTKEESAIEAAAPSSLRGDFVIVFGVVKQLSSALGKSGSMASLEAEAPKLEATVNRASFKHEAAAIKAWAVANHC
jgi:hypothetical protein